MPDTLAELRSARVVGAIVFDGSFENVDSVLRELRADPRVRTIYVRTSPGSKLRIVEEGR